MSPWWGPASGDPERLRAELKDDDMYTFVVEVGGAVAGWLAVTEESDPDWSSCALDIVLAAPYQDRGLGPEALETAIRWFIRERGHHRFTIDPALANERAINAYASVGYQRVGVLRRYQRGPDGEWTDALLMELMAEELRGGP